MNTSRISQVATHVIVKSPL